MKLKRTLETLQVGRAFAALCIVLFHVNETLALHKYLGREIFGLFSSGSFGRPFFFVLSGFVVFMAHEREIGRPESVVPFFWKRIRRIYPPLFVVLLLFVPVYFLVPSFRHGNETGLKTIVSAFLILPAQDDSIQDDNILAAEWTLRHEVLFYAIFALVLWRPRIGAVVAAIWLLFSAVVPICQLGYPFNFYFSGYHILFGMGVLASLAYARGRHQWPIAMILLGATILALTCYANLHGQEHDYRAEWAYGLGSTFLILGAANLEKVRGIRLPRILTFLGEASYSICLVNFPAVSVAAKLIVKINGKLPDAVLFLITVAIGVSVGIVFHIFVEKRVINWVRQLDALRSRRAEAAPFRGNGAEIREGTDTATS